MYNAHESVCFSKCEYMSLCRMEGWKPESVNVRRQIGTKSVSLSKLCEADVVQYIDR